MAPLQPARHLAASSKVPARRAECLALQHLGRFVLGDSRWTARVDTGILARRLACSGMEREALFGDRVWLS